MIEVYDHSVYTITLLNATFSLYNSPICCPLPT